MLLQVALDVVDLDVARAVAEQVCEVADRIEVGTPLLMRFGTSAIRAIRDIAPGLDVIADMKIMDCGSLLVEAAVEAGAAGVVVQALAPIETIFAASRVTERVGSFLIADCLGVEDWPQLALRLNAVPLREVVVHVGKDEQRCGVSLRERLAALPPQLSFDVAVAGGLVLEDLADVKADCRVKVVIIGEAIYRSPTPSLEAFAFKRALAREPVDVSGALHV